MKILDIAYKDMLRYFRSAFAVGMMLVVPLLITALIYAAFGGVLATSETEVYTLPVIRLQVLNLDAGDKTGQFNAGDMLVDALRSDSVQDVFQVTLADSESSARAAVDRQQAALAVIIPEHFTRAAISGQGEGEIEFYEDPALSFGPGITREIIGQFLDVLSGGQIAGSVLREQFSARGLPAHVELQQQVQVDYSNWFFRLSGEQSWNLPLEKRLPNRTDAKSITDHRTTLMGPVMAGMMIFFVFFTGANTAQSIIKEQEEGTLARMFTTPTRYEFILGGKFVAVFLTLAVQSVVLTVASGLIFGIDWGNISALALVIVGLVVAGAGFGILLMSLITTTRQAGALTGGVLALMGMVGGLFTTGLPGVPPALETAGLFIPQGWALRGLRLVLFGAAPQDVLIPAAVLLIFGLVFFVVGARKFSGRFA
jgi:ABC-type multidrug transport system permease subunit